MKTDHAHVEASVISIVLTAVVAIADYFIDLMDGDPLKLVAYLVGYLALYVCFYLIMRKLWKG